MYFALDVNIGQWQKGDASVEYVRDISYIKALGGAIGMVLILKQRQCSLAAQVQNPPPAY